MTLGDVVGQLKYGELRSIAVKDDNFAITSYINLAIQALYNRFTLKVNEQIIDLKSNIVDYKLNADVTTIDSIYDENGDEFDIDNPTNLFSIQILDYETIQVPNPSTGASISVIYKASPTFITYVDESSLSQVIPLPQSLLEPLLHYVGYRAHGSMDGNIKAENNTHYMRFIDSCNRIDKLGIIRKAIPPANISQSEDISETAVTYQSQRTI